MESDVGIMMIWPMAAMEAQALGWSEIEPVHLLCAALKFAELGADDLGRLGEAAGGAEELQQRHRDLRDRLYEPWGIVVPDVSTPLRRALRKQGGGEPNLNGGMIHRSNAAREVFRAAQEQAEQSGRQQFDIVDLTCAILRNPDEWIRQKLDQHNIISASQLQQRDEEIGKWSEFFIPLKSSASADNAEKKRILADPAVSVLADVISNPTPRPILLIHGPDRTALDVITDLLNRPSESKLPKITQINSRVLLQRLSEDTKLSAATFLDFLVNDTKDNAVWFFDSLHRYLADELTPPAFLPRFVQWLKQTNSHFIFAIPNSQYERQAERNPAWKDMFQAIWIRNPSQSAIMEL